MSILSCNHTAVFFNINVRKIAFFFTFDSMVLRGRHLHGNRIPNFTIGSIAFIPSLV